MSNKQRFNDFGLTLGMPLERPNRNVGTPNAPPPPVTASPGRGDRETEMLTFFTKVGPQPRSQNILYNNERQWAKITVTLETAGPVAIGNRADLFPVLSGKGELLATGVPTVIHMGKGNNRLYYAATAVSRLKLQIEPLPWLEEITSNLIELRNALIGRK